MFVAEVNAIGGNRIIQAFRSRQMTSALWSNAFQRKIFKESSEEERSRIRKEEAEIEMIKLMRDFTNRSNKTINCPWVNLNKLEGGDGQ